MKQVAVIGAGIAGLTCAYDLARAGVDVTVYEKEATVGGRMRTRSLDGLAFDLGANFLVQAYRQVTSLATALQVGLRNVSPVQHAVYRQGRWLRMNLSGASHILRLDALGLLSTARFLALIARLRAGQQLDFFDLSRGRLPLDDAYQYALTRAGRDFADYVADPFSSCMMFSRAAEHSSLTLRALLAMMASSRFDFSILYADGDMQAIPDALSRGLAVRLGCSVESLARAPGGWRLQVGGEEHRYERVVLATTAGAAAPLLVEAPAEHRQVVGGTRYASTVNLAFRVPCEALGDTHCFYVPYCENQVISEYTNEALKGADTTRDGWSLVNVGLHEAAAARWLRHPDGALFERVAAELRRLQPDLGAVAYDLQRWPEALPKYDREHIQRVRDFQAEGQGKAGLFLCGDYLNAPWVEGASRSGRYVASCILSELLL